MSTTTKQANIAENKYLHLEKQANHGLGRRARRRLLAGIRKPETLAERMYLVDAGKEDLIPKN